MRFTLIRIAYGGFGLSRRRSIIPLVIWQLLTILIEPHSSPAASVVPAKSAVEAANATESLICLETRYLIDADGIRVGDIQTWSNALTQEIFTRTRHRILDTVRRAGVADVLAELEDGITRSSFLLGHGPHAEIELNGDIQQGRRFYITDGHGSVRQTADPESPNFFSELLLYDAFGQLLTESSLWQATPLPSYRYAGAFFDSASGVYTLAHREYDPLLGQFATPDRMEGNGFDPPSRHRYLYARNDPINRLDPSGDADYNAVSLLTAASVAGTLAAIDARIASRGMASGNQVALSFVKGATLGVGAYVAAPLFLAAGAGGRIAFEALSLASAFGGIGEAIRRRDAKLLGYRALTLAISTALHAEEGKVRVYQVEGETQTRILSTEQGEIVIQGDSYLFLNFGHHEHVEEFLQREYGIAGPPSTTLKVPRGFLESIRHQAVDSQEVDHLENHPIRINLTKAAADNAIAPEELDALLRTLRSRFEPPSQP